MKSRRGVLLVTLLLATQTTAAARAVDVNDIAEGYVRLVLEVGLYDEDYVDAYVGPAAWEPGEDQAKEPFPASRLRARADALAKQLQEIDRDQSAGIHQQRYDYLDRQLRSVRGKIDLLAGVTMSFDEESRILYDAVAPLDAGDSSKPYSPRRKPPRPWPPAALIGGFCLGNHVGLPTRVIAIGGRALVSLGAERAETAYL
ncbi:MAG: hypothetical protein JSW27_23825 [Phycisphaerales bacterium]|nr:MAG: hypothetical protein JSW27_23825 [Phycisphaerales bacterium]